MAKELINFITNASLYERFEFDNNILQQLVDIYSGKERFEAFCPKCGDKKVFLYDTGLNEYLIKNISNYIYSTGSFTGVYNQKHGQLKQFGHIFICFKCSLDESHKQEYFFSVREDSIIKAGQFPSSADQDLPQALKYNKILGEQYYSELKRAIGLHAHGVGIGSFVYLRRIIEKLVYDAFKKAEATGGITETKFEYNPDGKHRNGMEEKIKLLRGFLPKLITDNPRIYSIVSKGIHELSERKCMEYFPILKAGVIMILDDIVAKTEKEQAAKEYEKDLGKILSHLE